MEGTVVKRKLLNSKLGFFHFRKDNDNEEVQIRLKTTELCYLENQTDLYSVYTSQEKDPVNPIQDWKLNCIKVGTRIKVEGHTEETDRGTVRFIVQRLTLFKDNDQPSNTRNLRSQSSSNHAICKKWAKQEFINNQKEEIQNTVITLEKWKEGCKLDKNCNFRHHWTSESERKSFLNHLDKQRIKIIAEYDPNDPFHASDVISRTKRGQLFADWIFNIIQKMNLKTVNIIDVAGGSGSLLKELIIRLYPICDNATLIEPNTRKITPKILVSKIKNRLRQENNQDCLQNTLTLPKISFIQSYFDKDFYCNPENKYLFNQCNTLSKLVFFYNFCKNQL